MREPAAEALRADGIRGDLRRLLVGWKILCVDEPVCVGTADGGLGRGCCGTAAGRGEEGWACAAQVGSAHSPSRGPTWPFKPSAALYGHSFQMGKRLSAYEVSAQQGD